MIKIMLDAGHYGKYNQSPAFTPYYESDMTWKLCNLLAAELEKYGFNVGKTRADKDTDIDVYYRGKKAKGYDMFISLHSNATGRNVNDAVDRPVVYRLSRDTDSEVFAQSIADKIAELMNTKQKGKTGTRLQENGTEYYGVLRGADSVKCPHAFIIEHSFHTATKPAKWLYDESNLYLLAVQEAKIIAEFFGIKGEDKMTNEEVNALINERIDQALSDETLKSGKTYHYYSELPDYARDIITALHKKGVFVGNGAGDMNLSEDMMRMLVILVNAGVIKA